MSLHVYNYPQRSDEWFAARCGIVTASVIGQLITERSLGALDYECPACHALPQQPCVSKVKRGGEIGAVIKNPHPERTEHAAANAANAPKILENADNDTSRALTATLAAERVLGYTEPSTYMSPDMWRGVEEEPRARDRYAEVNGVEVAEVGLLVRDDWGWSLGYSPDGLVGEDGLLEVKAPRAKTHLRTVISGEVPDFYMPQIQAGLLVSGRKWLDWVPWFGGLPLWTKRVYPDPRWQEAIVAAVRHFETECAELVASYNAAVEGLPPTERLDLELVI